MWNIAVCDDDKTVCRQVQALLYQYSIDLKISVFNSGSELLRNNNPYDIIFLDVEMPEINGIKTTDELRRRNKNIYVIFLTNHPNYIDEAFKVRAYRYFNKPVSQSRLCEVMREVEREALEEAKISLSSKGRTCIVNISDITHIEAYGDGTYIYTPQNVYESREQLKTWLIRLKPFPFIHIHKSFAVSAGKIIDYTKGGVILKGNIKVPVSRRKYQNLKESLNENIRELKIIM